MGDVGWGEILFLAVIALVIFGPEKLPKAAADAGRLVRKLRELAASAQQEVRGHGIDVEGIRNDLRGVSDLHPKRIIGSAFSEITGPGSNPSASTTSPPIAARPTTSAPDGLPTPPPTHIRLDPDAT